MFVGILRSPLIFTNENEGLLVWLSPNIFHKNLGDWKAIILSPVVSPPGRGRSPPEQGRTTPPENSKFSQKLNLVTMQDKKQLTTAYFCHFLGFNAKNVPPVSWAGAPSPSGAGRPPIPSGAEKGQNQVFWSIECFPSFRYIGSLECFSPW